MEFTQKKKNLSQQIQVQDHTDSLVNSTKSFNRGNSYPQTILKNWMWRKIYIILQSQHHPDTKTGQKHHKKGKLQASIIDEHRSKNPQQNISKPNSTMY